MTPHDSRETRAVRALVTIAHDREYHRLHLVASALETAHHALLTAIRAAEEECGDAWADQLDKMADDLWARCERVRWRAEQRLEEARR